MLALKDVIMAMIYKWRCILHIFAYTIIVILLVCQFTKCRNLEHKYNEFIEFYFKTCERYDTSLFDAAKSVDIYRVQNHKLLDILNKYDKRQIALHHRISLLESLNRIEKVLKEDD